MVEVQLIMNECTYVDEEAIDRFIWHVEQGGEGPSWKMLLELGQRTLSQMVMPDQLQVYAPRNWLDVCQVQGMVCDEPPEFMTDDGSLFCRHHRLLSAEESYEAYCA